MNYDAFGEVINGEDTYDDVAQTLFKMRSPVLVGWTDQHGSHHDVLFCRRVAFSGNNIQGGLRSEDLFVSVMRFGAFGFEINPSLIHEAYYGEKLGLGYGSTTTALAALIRGVTSRLYELERV